MKRKHIIRACLLLFCLLLCTACRSESKPKETRFSFVSEDSLTIVNAEGQELHFADKVWSGTMPVLDCHFTVDFVPGSTSVQVRFSESFSVRFEPERAKDRSICLSFDGDDFRAVEGPGLQNVEYTRSTVEATGENMQYETQRQFRLCISRYVVPVALSSAFPKDFPCFPAFLKLPRLLAQSACLWGLHRN